MAKPSSPIPARKVSAGLAAGSVSILMGWILKQVLDVDMRAEVGSAFTTVFTFAASYSNSCMVFD